QSDLKHVTPENLVVIGVAYKCVTGVSPWIFQLNDCCLYSTPFKRLTTYHIPTGLPLCPEEGCICAWGWIPNGCRERNMYHEAIRCKVTGNTGTKPIGKPRPPVWCEGDPDSCIKGPKQMLYWNQASGSNIVVDLYV
ncbi:hypothetical protein GYMLUDRAFT_413966, partial [Collybiopsis luxurians FD-317 M1]